MSVLDATRVIQGQYGYVYDENGNWMSHVKSLQASVDINKEDVPRAGSRRMGKKTSTIDMTGSMTAYKITSDMIKRLADSVKDGGKPFVTQIIVKLDDPESYGAERILLKGVQFDNVPLINFEVGSIVEEEFNFTFDDFEFLDVITAE